MDGEDGRMLDSNQCSGEEKSLILLATLATLRGWSQSQPIRAKTPLIGTWPGQGRGEGELQLQVISSYPLRTPSTHSLNSFLEGETTGRDSTMHTPLHLLVNRINQRHHGLSPTNTKLLSELLNPFTHF
ncbi:hypothetical protein KQX54_017663 [Cotesia glomerata]|uniref:Uncharacterized protein n=1 Tax=Cotesia glomerata TaxID=32391 RepID=A0AAV7I980_COTGL|nr:hypothetical protein KQX54_017663 [Cotesia glomerata]